MDLGMDRINAVGHGGHHRVARGTASHRLAPSRVIDFYGCTLRQLQL